MEGGAGDDRSTATAFSRQRGRVGRRPEQASQPGPAVPALKLTPLCTLAPNYLQRYFNLYPKDLTFANVMALFK